MGFTPGNGVGLGKVILGGVLFLGATVGLATGLGIEASKKAVYDSEVSKLRDELDTSKKIASDINIFPPGGRGFINSK